MPKRRTNQKAAAPYDLKATRERLSLTQKDMAQLLESGQSSIARWESEGSLPLIYRKFLDLYERHEHGKPAKRDRRRHPVSPKAKSSKAAAAVVA